MRRDLSQLAAQEFDLAVVGGGVHGAWVALRAAAAGLRTALLERDDFGAATSANSLRILHGGLRYLQSLDVVRMRRSVRARRSFARLAPQLVTPLGCLLPLGPLGLRSPWAFGPALLINEIVSSGQRRGVVARARLPRGRLLSARDAAAQIAPYARRRVAGGGVWWDMLLDDAERMTVEVVLAAAAHGACVANRVEARALRVASGRVTGVLAQDRAGERPFEIKARTVVDATGPWAGRLAAASGLPRSERLPTRWLGALNIVVRRRMSQPLAVALTAGSGVDRRELFLVPFQGALMIGTDYVPVEGPGATIPKGLVERFVELVGRVAPQLDLRLADVVNLHWGVLPAAATHGLQPASSAIVTDAAAEQGPQGLVTVVGEKYTSAPVVSADVLRLVGGGTPDIGDDEALLRPCGTPDDTDRRPEPAAVPERYRARYPRSWPSLVELCSRDPRLAAPLSAEVAATGAEVVHAIRAEMALDLADVVLRRLGLGATGHPGAEVLGRCAEFAAPEFGWSAAQAEAAAQALDEAFERRRRAQIGAM